MLPFRATLVERLYTSLLTTVFGVNELNNPLPAPETIPTTDPHIKPSEAPSMNFSSLIEDEIPPNMKPREAANPPVVNAPIDIERAEPNADDAENITIAVAIVATVTAATASTATPITIFHAQCSNPLGSRYMTGVLKQ